MNSSDPREHQPFAGLAVAMIRHGLPAEYVERTAAEIVDHHRDLVTELRATGLSESQAAAEAARRLGDSRTLVKKTVREYQRRHWCGRWPILSFVVAPPLAFVVAWWMAGAVLVLSFRLCGIHGSADISNVFVRLGVGHMFGITMFHVVPMLVAIGFVHYARRAACGMAWMVASGLGIGLFAALQVWFVDEQRFGFTIAFESVQHFMRWYVLNPWQWFQLALPLAVGLGFHGYLESRNRCNRATEGYHDHAQRAA
jgi:hypothetical protein